MPVCSESECAVPAEYWFYEAPCEMWRPICSRHAEHLHPSLEIHAWLTSGYLKPIELQQPTSPPETPTEERAKEFRSEVDQTMNW